MYNITTPSFSEWHLNRQIAKAKRKDQDKVSVLAGVAIFLLITLIAFYV